MSGREPDDDPRPDAADPAFRERGIDETTAEAVLEAALDETGDPDAETTPIGVDWTGADEGSEPEPEPEPEEALSDPLTEERELGEAEQRRSARHTDTSGRSSKPDPTATGGSSAGSNRPVSGTPTTNT